MSSLAPLVRLTLDLAIGGLAEEVDRNSGGHYSSPLARKSDSGLRTVVGEDPAGFVASTTILRSPDPYPRLGEREESSSMSRSDHSTETAVCPKCEDLFTRRDSLRRHLGAQHGLMGRTLSITVDVAIRTYQERRTVGIRG